MECCGIEIRNPLLYHCIEAFLLNRTAGETSDRSERIPECHQSHTLTSRFAPPPYQRRTPKLSLDRTPRSGTPADRSCPRREFPANPCLYRPGTSCFPKPFPSPHTPNIECRSRCCVR